MMPVEDSGNAAMRRLVVEQSGCQSPGIWVAVSFRFSANADRVGGVRGN